MEIKAKPQTDTSDSNDNKVGLSADYVKKYFAKKDKQVNDMLEEAYAEDPRMAYLLSFFIYDLEFDIWKDDDSTDPERSGCSDQESCIT